MTDREPTTATMEIRARSRELFELMRDCGSDAQRSQHREDLVHLHLPMVTHYARRFTDRGQPLEDLIQIGTIGLLKAIDRFDLERGVEFSTFATPTILGEIRRFFRDKGWAVRVPRRLQDLRMQIGAVTGDLTQQLGRAPTPRELAEHLDIDVSEVLEGLESANVYATLSLNASTHDDDGDNPLLRSLGSEDEAMEHVELRESIRPLLDNLPAREREILMLRFFRNMTQSQIATEVGISQMHVSRLLNRTLATLREALEEVH